MARGNPVTNLSKVDDGQDKHEKMLSDMHDALYSLGDAIRKPGGLSGGRPGAKKLLPPEIAGPSDTPEAKTARKHIETIHAAMKDCAY